MHWDDLHTLSTLVRTGTYSGCARELGLTHATAIRRLKRLEACLQVPLTVPSSQGIELSPAGQIALEAARQMEASADRVLREMEAADGAMAGSVRITATESLGTQFLTPRLGALRERHPGLRVELIVDNRNLSLARRKAHIAVRLDRPREEQLVAKRVARMGFGVFATRKLLARAGTQPVELAIPFCQLEAGDAAGLPEVRWVAEHVPRNAIAYVSNSLNGIVEAARQGLGAAVLPHYLAAAAAPLVLARELPQVWREVWVAYPPEYRREPRFRAAIDWLVETLQGELR
jgi:DNA-binding transcriptional LysR family regulator